MAELGRDLGGQLVYSPCPSKITYSQLQRTVPRWLLNISSGGDSTTTVGNPFQCSVSLTIRKFCLMFQFVPLPLTFIPTQWFNFNIKWKLSLHLYFHRLYQIATIQTLHKKKDLKTKAPTSYFMRAMSCLQPHYELNPMLWLCSMEHRHQSGPAGCLFISCRYLSRCI